MKNKITSIINNNMENDIKTLKKIVSKQRNEIIRLYKNNDRLARQFKRLEIEVSSLSVNINRRN